MHKSESPMHSRDVVTKHYYNDPMKLGSRLLAWELFGSNKKKSLRQRLLEIIKRELRDRNSCALLDAGCGSGEFIQYLLDNDPLLFNSVCGIDISPAMIASCRGKMGAGILKFAVCEVSALPYPDQTFDVVTCCHVLHHVENIKQALGSLFRVVRQNGILLLTTLDPCLDDGLNLIHYRAVASVGMPAFMADITNYMRFAVPNAKKILTEIFHVFESETYENNLNFPDMPSAMEYYRSAMMFRNAKGTTDERISPEKWTQLEAFVGEQIERELEGKKVFSTSGRVGIFLIRKGNC